MMGDTYVVYAKVDQSGRITAVNSSGFVSSGWGIAIDSGSGDKYHHAQGNYFQGGIRTEDGICRWKYVNGEVLLRNAQEIAQDRAEIPPEPPTQHEIDRADIDYCLMMLEG